MNLKKDDLPPQVAAIAASTQEKLLSLTHEWLNKLEKNANFFEEFVKGTDPSEISAAPYRISFATRSPQELAQQLARALRFLETGKGKRMLAARSIFVTDQKKNTGKVAMLFPGQGAQSVGMMAELAEHFDIVRETLAEADEVLANELDRPLTDYLFGLGVSAEEATRALTQTAITQPAILASDLAMLRLLRAHEIEPDLVAGHSLGEYAACVAAGVLSVPDALRAVAVRGRAMTNATPEGTDPGAMAAVGAPHDQVEPLLRKIEGYIIPANKNCYAQTIVAGETETIDRAMELFDEEGLQSTRLPVSHAFHTRIVEPASKNLAEFLSSVEIKAPQIPVLSNVTGAEYPTGNQAPLEIARLLSNQVASPVEFIAEIERMYELGARTFVEVGPRRTLSTFVGNILSKHPHFAVATHNKRKGELRSFIDALSALLAAGLTPKLDVA